MNASTTEHELTPSDVAQRSMEVVHVPAPECQNCGAKITGRYCSECGQHYEPHIHSLGHFTSEAFESITHADSRIWRTLWPLLTKPGFLTKEFFEGRRSRYLPPFRLYLVVSAIFFLLMAVLPSHDNYYAMDARTHQLIPLNENAVKANEEKAAKTDESPEARANRICEDAGYTGPGENFIQPRLTEGCRKIVVDNGRAFVHAFIGNIPRSLFILIPALAAVMKLMYWRPKRHYVEHLLFFIHNHAFVFLLSSLYLLISPFAERITPRSALGFVVWLYMVYYSYKAMRRYYGQGRWLTRSKFVVLSFAYFMGATALLSLVAFLSVFTI